MPETRTCQLRFARFSNGCTLRAISRVAAASLQARLSFEDTPARVGYV